MCVDPGARQPGSGAKLCQFLTVLSQDNSFYFSAPSLPHMKNRDTVSIFKVSSLQPPCENEMCEYLQSTQLSFPFFSADPSGLPFSQLIINLYQLYKFINKYITSVVCGLCWNLLPAFTEHLHIWIRFETNCKGHRVYSSSVQFRVIFCSPFDI